MITVTPQNKTLAAGFTAEVETVKGLINGCKNKHYQNPVDYPTQQPLVTGPVDLLIAEPTLNEIGVNTKAQLKALADKLKDNNETHQAHFNDALLLVFAANTRNELSEIINTFNQAFVIPGLKQMDLKMRYDQDQNNFIKDQPKPIFYKKAGVLSTLEQMRTAFNPSETLANQATTLKDKLLNLAEKKAQATPQAPQNLPGNAFYLNNTQSLAVDIEQVNIADFPHAAAVLILGDLTGLKEVLA